MEVVVTPELQTISILVGVPVLAAALAWWRQSLLVAILMVVVIYVMYIVYLFRAPFWLVAACWVGCAVLNAVAMMFLFPKFGRARKVIPGQLVSSLFMWPVSSMISGLAMPDQIDQRKRRRKRRAAEVEASQTEQAIEGEIQGMVSFIEPAGVDGDVLMVYIAEFGNTVFYGSSSLLEDGALAESGSFDFSIERKHVDELGRNIPWIATARPA